MQPGLAKLVQDDFAAGMVRSTARHLIPDNGVYDAVNLLTDDDGSLYKRAGSEYQSTTNFGSTGLRSLWDGYVAAGQRTVFADSAAYGVLAADDVTPVNLGGSGLTVPTRAVEIMGILFIDGGVMYAGSRKAADYSTSTVSVTNGSKTVTGAASVWSTNADAGMLLKVAGAGRYYPVASVDSNTQLTLRDNYQGSTAAGQAYALTRLGSASAAPYAHTGPYAVVANRLISGEGNKVYFSNTIVSGNGPHVWDTTDFWELPAGAQILGVEAIRDTLLVFTNVGTWSISGLAADLTDSAGNIQQRLERVGREMVLWSRAGIAAWQNSLVVPSTDGVWLMDGVSAPTRLSNSITPMVKSYVAAGYMPGLAAVHRNHYVMPVVDSTTGAWVDLLVCRLDRSVSTRLGAMFPWVRLDGSGAQVTAVSERIVTGTARTPLLLGAGRQTTGRVLKLNYFDPTAARKNDHDGTTFLWQQTSRNYETGNGNSNLVKRIRARYELIDAASDDPKIQAYFSIGTRSSSGSLWGTALWGTALWTDSTLDEYTLLSGSAREDDGRSPFTWTSSLRGRFVRLRLQSADPAASMALRSISLFIRPSGKDV